MTDKGKTLKIHVCGSTFMLCFPLVLSDPNFHKAIMCGSQVCKEKSNYTPRCCDHLRVTDKCCYSPRWFFEWYFWLWAVIVLMVLVSCGIYWCKKKQIIRRQISSVERGSLRRATSTVTSEYVGSDFQAKDYVTDKPPSYQDVQRNSFPALQYSSISPSHRTTIPEIPFSS